MTVFGKWKPVERLTMEVLRWDVNASAKSQPCLKLCSPQATLYARQEHAEMLLGMSSPDTLQYWKRTACRLGRVWSERDSLPACKAAETHARNCAVASLQQFDVIVRRFRSRKYGGDASRLRLETLQVSVTEPKSYCRDLLDKLRSLE
jgi:hypothetical protein